MAEYISAMEASRRYHLSDKTIRKWIKSGKLPAQEQFIEGLRQYAISTDDIELLLIRRTTQRDGIYPADTGMSLLEHLQEMEARLADVEEKLNSLTQLCEALKHRVDEREAHQIAPESVQQPLVPLSPLALPRYDKPARNQSQAQTEAHKRGLPEGLVNFTDFYRWHGISSRAAGRGKDNHAFAVQIGNWWDEKGHRITLALDEEGQRDFCRYFRARGKLQECEREECVCHTI
jgi:hypothetical protein